MPAPPDDKNSIPDSELAKLTPEARLKVQNALKASVESELAGGATLKAAEFSRGWVFSRSRPKPEAQHEQEIMRNASAMDEATFAKFAKNLSALKNKGQG